MQVAGFVLGCLLLGQTSDARLRPADMVAEAMRLPSGGAIVGQPVSLAGVLASTQDRRQQLEMTYAYWRLVQAVAEYHYCVEHAQNTERLKPASGEPASLRLARASAAAMVRQAELDAATAQCELARLMRLPGGSALPLPTDLPHVGDYKTSFQELYAGRTAPEAAVLMERVLPIRRQVVDGQAAALVAAEDVLTALREQPRADVETSLTCNRELLRQQRAFIRAVCDYNRNIALYGLTVASPMTTPQALITFLIPSAQPAGTPAVARNVQPSAAGQWQPATTVPASAAPRTGWPTGQPTPAPPRYNMPKSEPTVAPQRGGLRPVVHDEAPTTPREKLQPVGKNEPTFVVPRDRNRKKSDLVEDDDLVPIDPGTAKPVVEPRTARKPVAESDTATVAVVTPISPSYGALAAAAPAVRAKHLTAALHRAGTLPNVAGKPLSLADCMLRDPGTDRRATIDAYWLARQRAAEYQSLAEQAAMLKALEPAALQHRNRPADMLRLRQTQLAAQASLDEARAALIEAQYTLALRIGAAGEAAWPLASTVPHSGSYLLQLDAQPQSVAESWPIRRLAATIPALGQNVQQYAAVVVEADSLRAAVAEDYRAGTATVDQAIDAVATQTQQTTRLLATLTDYNRAIAEYVLTVMPRATPTNRLVAALVVKP
jgi:hypothetical protein